MPVPGMGGERVGIRLKEQFGTLAMAVRQEIRGPSGLVLWAAGRCSVFEPLREATGRSCWCQKHVAEMKLRDKRLEGRNHVRRWLFVFCFCVFVGVGRVGHSLGMQERRCGSTRKAVRAEREKPIRELGTETDMPWLAIWIWGKESVWLLTEAVTNDHQRDGFNSAGGPGVCRPVSLREDKGRVCLPFAAFGNGSHSLTRGPSIFKARAIESFLRLIDWLFSSHFHIEGPW